MVISKQKPSFSSRHFNFVMESTLAIVFLFGVAPIATFCMIWGVRYLENKENMAMIERGMNPKDKNKNKRLNPSQTLKNGMMFAGAGIGLLCALFVSEGIFPHASEGVRTGLFFAFIALFGGLGRLGSYF